MHQLTHRPLRLAAAVAILTLALVAAAVLARGTVAHASGVRVAGIKLATRGPVDVATVHVTLTVVTFLLPVGAPVTVDAPAPRNCPL